MALRVKAKKSERPVYAFQRVNNSLVPEMSFDLAALDGIAQGERVRVEIKQWRNSGRMRAYWSMLAEVVSSCDLPYRTEKLHEIAKMKNGVIDLVMLPDGTPIATPGSISFETMPEHEFVDYFRKVERWLAETFHYVRSEAA